MLTDDEWAAALTDADGRGLTVVLDPRRPYGEVKVGRVNVDMTTR